MQKVTFAVAIQRLFSPNIAFYDESKSHINNITCIEFQCSRNSTNIIIKFTDFLYTLCWITLWFMFMSRYRRCIWDRQYH